MSVVGMHGRLHGKVCQYMGGEDDRGRKRMKSPPLVYVIDHALTGTSDERCNWVTFRRLSKTGKLMAGKRNLGGDYDIPGNFRRVQGARVKRTMTIHLPAEWVW